MMLRVTRVHEAMNVTGPPRAASPGFGVGPDHGLVWSRRASAGQVIPSRREGLTLCAGYVADASSPQAKPWHRPLVLPALV